MNLVSYLKTVPDFSAISSKDLEVLEKAMAVTRHPDGHVFIHKGKTGKDMHLIIEGKVNLYHQDLDTDEHQTLETLYPGDLFGVLSFVTKEKSLVSYVADGEVTTASLPKSAFIMLYDSKSTLAHHFQHIIARQLTRNYRNIIQLLKSVIFSKLENVTTENLESMLWQYRRHDRRQGIDRRQNDERRITPE